MSFKVLKANYGVGQSVMDVTEKLNSKIKDNRLTFAVTNESFNKDPAPLKKKVLTIEYEDESGDVHEKEFREGVVIELPNPKKANSKHRYLLNLPEVTLATICWGNNSFLTSAIWAYKQFNKKTKFGEKIFFISEDIDVDEYGDFFEEEEVLVSRVKSGYTLKDYSHFVVKDLNDFVNTDFVMLFQNDGFIENIDMWSDEYFDYDYIGAPWWYKDHNNVGNGGFSMRSKKLLEVLAADEKILDVVPEDHHICRTYGDYLREEHGIKFAPEELASKFSVEHGHHGGQLGFHGAWQLESYLKRLSS
jgi:hypothetical protein